MIKITQHMKIYRYAVMFLFIALLGFVLNGCHTTAKVVFQHQQKKISPKKRLAMQRHAWLKQLGRDHIQVIHLGDSFRFILPAEHFFYKDSPRVLPIKYQTLNLLVKYLATFQKIAVTVSGYTDNACSRSRNTALARERAQIISNYLWDKRIDVRLIQVVSHADCNPIASNRSSAGRMENNRVEITFTRMVPTPLI